MSRFEAFVLTGRAELAGPLQVVLSELGGLVVRAGRGEHEPAGPAPGIGVGMIIDPARLGAPDELLGAVPALLAACGRFPQACVVRADPMTDTLKRVDHDGFVLETADRAHHRSVAGPVAGPWAAVAAVARRARDLDDALVALSAAGPVRTLPPPPAAPPPG